MHGIHHVRCSVFRLIVFVSVVQKFRKLKDDKDKDSYSITRICLPNCERDDDGQEYTECCSKDKCNGAVSRSTLSSSSLLTYAITLCLVLLFNSS